MSAANPLPHGFAEWLLQQANDPTDCDLVDLGQGRLKITEQGRQDPIGDLGAALRWHLDTDGDAPEDYADVAQIALDERAARGLHVFRSDVERAVRDALHEFARHERRRLK